MPKSLFDSVAIGKVNIPNRLVRSATWEGMCEESGRPTTRLNELYRRLAEGKVGLIVSGYTYVRPEGKQLPGKMGIYSDDLISSLRELTDAVHDAGGLVFCQLVHAGGQASSRVTGTQPVAPSAVDFPTYTETPRELDPKEIEDIVKAFGEGARRAREAGFDGVQIHGAHGYLVNQFLSPLTNRRTDSYGGSLENRLRFLREVYQAIREQVGDSCPVAIKLTASDNLPGGFEIEDAVKVSSELEKFGIDAIEVSSGTNASGENNPVRRGIDMPEQEGYNTGFAYRIKKAVAIPVMTVGGLRSTRVIENQLNEGFADFFALSRPLIREPDLPEKWKTQPSHKATCISCNGCFVPGRKEGGIYCVVEKQESSD